MSAIQLMHRAVKGDPGVQPQFNPMSSFCSNAGNVDAGVRFNNDGTVDIEGQGCGPFQFDQNFLTVGGFAGAADDFEVMLSVNAFTGPDAGDSIDTWLALTSNRTWTWSGFNEFNMGDWQIQVREVAVPANIDSEEYSWQVEDGS